jgi:phage recombination protein Bet
MIPQTQSTALAERKWTEKEIALVKGTCAPKCTDDEFNLLMYQSNIYHLDPLLRQIWAVKYDERQPARIFVGRDGFLAIAHQSRQFDGMDSGSVRDDKGELLGAWAKVWRKDMQHPFFTSVKLKEYDKQTANWKSMPETMIIKVAESQCLRKAFEISGVYSPEEFDGALEKTHNKVIKAIDEGDVEVFRPVIDAEEQQFIQEILNRIGKCKHYDDAVTKLEKLKVPKFTIERFKGIVRDGKITFPVL